MESLAFPRGKLAKGFLLRYSCLFAVFAFGFFALFIVEGKSPIRTFDGLDQQYAVFLYEGKYLRSIFRHLLAGDGLVVPLWDTSIGYGADIPTTWMGMFGGNPLYLLSALLPARCAELGLCLVIVLMMYLAGLFFGMFASVRICSGFGTLAGSLSYAFSGWMLLAFTESEFLVPAVYLPLLLLGVDRVLDGGSPVLLSVTTALLFAAYFYYGYMVSILLPAYALLRVFLTEACASRRFSEHLVHGLRRIVRAAAFYAVGIAMSAVVNLPIVATVLGQGRLGLERWSPLLYDMKYYPQLIAGVVSYADVGPDAFIGCGAIALPCVVLLLMREDVGRAPKVAFALLSLCLLLPLAGRLFNGMGYVTNRWAFAYALSLSMAVALMVDRLPFASIRERKTIAAVQCACMMTALVFPNTRTPHSFICLSVSLLFCLLPTVFNLADEDRAECRSLRMATIALLFLGSCVPAYYVAKATIQNEVDYGTAARLVYDSPVYRVLTEVSDDTLYRYDRMDVSRVRNSDMLARRNSYDFYMSVYDTGVERFEKGLELTESSLPQQVSGPSGSAYLHACLGTRYIVCPTEEESSLPYGFSRQPVTVVEAAGETFGAYRNDLALPLAYTLDGCSSTGYYESLTSMQKRQFLLHAVAIEDPDPGNAASGIAYSDTRPEVRATSYEGGLELTEGGFVVTREGATLTLEFEGAANSETFLEIRDLGFEAIPPAWVPSASLAQRIDNMEAAYLWTEGTSFSIAVQTPEGRQSTINASNYKNHMYGGKDSHLVWLGYSRESVTSVTLTFNTAGTYTYESMAVVQQPMDDLASQVDSLSEDEVSVVESTNSYQIDADVQKGKYLLLTVPWSGGWSARVDGKAVEVLRADIAFMAVEVPKGHHRIAFSYETPFLREGAAITLASTLMLVLVAFMQRQRIRGKQLRRQYANRLSGR